MSFTSVFVDISASGARVTLVCWIRRSFFFGAFLSIGSMSTLSVATSTFAVIGLKSFYKDRAGNQSGLENR